MRSTLRACLVLVALGAATLFACAETDEPAANEPLPDAEAGAPSVDAAAPTDAPADAGADADAALPECSDDGFCPTVVPPDQTLRGVWGDGTGIVWAVSEQGAVLRHDGTAWTVHASKLGALRAIWGSGPTDVWIGGEKGLYHGTSSGGASSSLTFTASPAPGAQIAISALWGAGANDVWAVGGTPVDRGTDPFTPPVGRVLHYTGASTDAGATWSLHAASSKGIAYSHVWGSVASGAWIAGPREVAGDEFFDEVIVLRKAPASNTFVEVVLPKDPLEDPVFGRLAKMTGGTLSGDSTMWILGRSASNAPGYWKGTSQGASGAFTFTYERGGNNDEPALNAVWGIAANDAWAVGDYGRVRHGTGTGTGTGSAWPQAAITRTKLPIIAPFYAVWSNGTKDLWVVGDGIALHLDPAKKKKTAGTP